MRQLIHEQIKKYLLSKGHTLDTDINEVTYTDHFNKDSYEARLINLENLDDSFKTEVKRKINFLKNVDFNLPHSGLGIMLGKLKKPIEYDKHVKKKTHKRVGNILWAIVRDKNEIDTMYYKLGGVNYVINKKDFKMFKKNKPTKIFDLNDDIIFNKLPSDIQNKVMESFGK
jgi:hypothetical protein